VNDSVCSLLGYTKAELLNTHISAYVDPKGLRTDPFKYTSLKKGEHVFNERLMRAKDHSLIWVDVNVKKFAENRILAIARDVTNSKKIQAELLESETKFRDLAEKTMVGFYITQDGKFQYVNRRFAQIFGYSEEVIAHISNSSKL
jgi:two-component system, sporulation sensor kinase E